MGIKPAMTLSTWEWNQKIMLKPTWCR